MWSRRRLGTTLAAMACSTGLPATASPAGSTGLRAIPLATHERAMRLAIVEARKNPAFPFGAVIAAAADGRIMATGVNNGAANPTFHGEIVALGDYVARHGNSGWEAMILYTTGEPCPMCMSALVWARIYGVVWGTSIDQLRRFGIAQIAIPAPEVVRAAPFYRGETLGPVLQAETDALFRNRQRA